MLVQEQLEMLKIDPRDIEGQGILIPDILRLIQSLEYGSVFSVYIKLLFYTGCRVAEIRRMKQSMVRQGWLYWQCGKNQQGQYRKEYLPSSFWEEWSFYAKNNRLPNDRLIGINEDTFRKYFTDIRPSLGVRWIEKKPFLRAGKFAEEYIYQLKGFRKNFATLLFEYYRSIKGYDDTTAVLMVCKRMRHSDKGITALHYIGTAEQIRAKQYITLMPFEMVNRYGQRLILDFF